MSDRFRTVTPWIFTALLVMLTTLVLIAVLATVMSYVYPPPYVTPAF